MKLVESLPSNHFVLYGDRFFSSIKLAWALRQRGLGYTGTINTNRLEKCPIDTKKFDKKPRWSAENATDESTGALIVAWKDNKTVCMITTADEVDPLHDAHRWSKEAKTRVRVVHQVSVTSHQVF